MNLLKNRSSFLSAEDLTLADICRKYQIDISMVEHLTQLENFEIVIVCDDSGSMKQQVDNTTRTRWDELCDIVKIVLDIGVKFDRNGVDIHFLNRNPLLKVKNPEIINETFRKLPSDYTPLVPVLRKLFQSALARENRDKKLLVLVATDGDPTDENGDSTVEEFLQLMTHGRNARTTYVSFLLCTDDAETVQCFANLDQTMLNVDVTDDYETEKEHIRQCKGRDYPFSHGDYVVKALVGSVIRDIDLLNEFVSN